MNPITPESWQRIEPILDVALELPVEARAAYLEGACEDDAQLGAQVEALLAAERAAGAFLETPVSAQLRAARWDPGDSGRAAPATDGERIGPYCILREIGHGGMGTVYLAERADGHFEQRVALKLIRRGMASDEILRRFLRERQILARLEHPHIAHLLDGGLTPEGQPWFAMEYVEGLPLTRYADEHRLGLEERLRLFGSVCDAVSHAHTAGVVHRDLKPANLLVTAAGKVKLLDFGIAKLLRQGGAAEETAATRVGLRLMTPEYAAPEQIRGEPVTPATDVYGLGVVLYELLSGHHPFRGGRQDASVGVERRVCEQEPLRPSTRVARSEEIQHGDGTSEAITPDSVSLSRSTTPERLRRRLAGDLDSIVLRALEKEPARRYPSADTLAEDLRRHLAGLPVLARRGSTAYRVRKFTRRHRTGVGMGAFAALVFGATSALVVARPGRPVTDSLPTNAPPVGVTTASIVAYRLYEEGLRAYYQQDLHGARRLFRAALAEDSTFPLAAYYALHTEWALNLPPDSALEVRMRRLADRLPERERLLVRGRMAWSTADPALRAIAETLTTHYPEEPEGHRLLGQALGASGELYRALPHLHRAVRMDSLGLRGAAADCRACDALAAMVSTFHALDSLAAAERTAREWVQLQPGSGRAWFALAEALEGQGKTEEALAAVRRLAPLAPGNRYVPIYPALQDIRAGEFEAADRLLREQARSAPADVQSNALWFLTISLRYQGRLREALATARTLRQLRPELREAIMAEAQVLFEMGRAREAAALFDSIAASPRPGETDHSLSGRRRWRSWHLTHAADALAAAGDTAGLEALADTIQALGALTLRGMHQRLHHHVRGLLLAARGRTADAAEEFYRATFWPIAPGSGFTRTNLELGRALVALDRPEEAVRMLQPALRGGLEAAAFYVTRTEVHEVLGQAWESAGHRDSAAVHYRRVLNAWRQADPQFDARRANVRRRLEALDRSSAPGALRERR